MEDSTSSPKFKVVMGSGPSQTIKRLNKSPENYEQLTKMIKSKLSERLFNNHSFYIYYENISNEMIKIEDDIDLECAIDSCTGKEKHSIKLHIYLEPIEDSKEQSDYKSTDPDRPSDDNYSDFCESEEIKRILQDHPFRPGELQQIGQLYKDSIARAREELTRLQNQQQIHLQENSDQNEKGQPDPLSLLVKDTESDFSSSSLYEESEESEEDSDIKDIENHNPSFLQYSNKEEKLKFELKPVQNEGVLSEIPQQSPQKMPESVNPEGRHSVKQMNELNELQQEFSDIKISHISPDPPGQKKPKLCCERLSFNAKDGIVKRNSESESEDFQSDKNGFSCHSQRFKGNEMYQHEVNSEMPECVFRNSSLSDPSKLEEEKSVAMNKQMDVQYDVYESVFARRICKLATEELPRMSPLKTFGSFLKTSFVGMDEEEADQLLRVDEEIIEYSNEDIISVKPGSVVRKCWRVKNIGTRQWPQDTRLVSVTDNLFFIGPQIHQFLKPGEMMDLGINIYINPQEDGDNNIQEYIVRLYSKQYKCFGQPMIATCHIDTNLYNESLKNQNEEDLKFIRVVSEGKLVENYEIARKISINEGDPFEATVFNLCQSDNYKHLNC